MSEEIKKALIGLEFAKENEDNDCLLFPKTAKTLLDYITTLQEENKVLKAKLEMYENGVYYSSENDKLQEKIDKAIECINYYAIENSDYEKIYNIEEETLLNILGGKNG